MNPGRCLNSLLARDDLELLSAGILGVATYWLMWRWLNPGLHAC